jgi:hypothetical protein
MSCKITSARFAEVARKEAIADRALEWEEHFELTRRERSLQSEEESGDAFQSLCPDSVQEDPDPASCSSGGVRQPQRRNRVLFLYDQNLEGWVGAKAVCGFCYTNASCYPHFIFLITQARRQGYSQSTAAKSFFFTV